MGRDEARCCLGLQPVLYGVTHGVCCQQTVATPQLCHADMPCCQWCVGPHSVLLEDHCLRTTSASTVQQPHSQADSRPSLPLPQITPPELPQGLQQWYSACLGPSAHLRNNGPCKQGGWCLGPVCRCCRSRKQLLLPHHDEQANQHSAPSGIRVQRLCIGCGTGTRQPPSHPPPCTWNKGRVACPRVQVMAQAVAGTVVNELHTQQPAPRVQARLREDVPVRVRACRQPHVMVAGKGPCKHASACQCRAS